MSRVRTRLLQRRLAVEKRGFEVARGWSCAAPSGAETEDTYERCLRNLEREITLARVHALLGSDGSISIWS